MLPAFWMHSRNFMLKVSWWLKRNLKQIQANYHSLLLGVWVSHRERMDPPLCGKTAILMFLLMPSPPQQLLRTANTTYASSSENKRTILDSGIVLKIVAAMKRRFWGSFCHPTVIFHLFSFLFNITIVLF